MPGHTSERADEKARRVAPLLRGRGSQGWLNLGGVLLVGDGARHAAVDSPAGDAELALLGEEPAVCSPRVGTHRAPRGGSRMVDIREVGREPARFRAVVPPGEAESIESARPTPPTTPLRRTPAKESP